MSKKVPYQNLDADESEDLAFGGPCELIGGSAYNGHSAVTFLKIYDAAAVSAVTVGTTVPKFVIGIPRHKRRCDSSRRLHFGRSGGLHTERRSCRRD
jgi:hypothetical protein